MFRELPSDSPQVSGRRERRGLTDCNTLIFSSGGEKSGSQRSPFIDVQAISSDEEEDQQLQHRTASNTKGWLRPQSGGELRS